jgi:hypothetical protein
MAEPINRWHLRKRLKTTIVEQINTKQRAFELIKDSSDGLYDLKNCN